MGLMGSRCGGGGGGEGNRVPSDHVILGVGVSKILIFITGLDPKTTVTGS